MQNLSELREQYQSISRELTDILATQETENRAFTDDEFEQINNLEETKAQLKREIDTLETKERFANELRSKPNKDGKKSAPLVKVARKIERADYARAMQAWLLAGDGQDYLTTAMERSADMLGVDINRKEFICRDQTTDTTTEGGFLLNDSTYMGTVFAKKAISNVESVSTVIPAGKGTFHYVTVNDTANGAAQRENQVDEVDNTDVVFNRKQIDLHSIATGVYPISWDSIEDTDNYILTMVENLVGLRLRRAKNDALTNNDGDSTNYGFLEDVEVVENAFSDAITDVNLTTAYFSLDPDYRENAVWMMHDATLASLIATLVVDVESDRRPIWGSGLNNSPEGSILGKRVVINNDMPIMESGTPAIPIVFGDFSNFIVRSSGPRLVKDNSIYSKQLCTAVFAYERLGSRLVDAGTHPIVGIQTGTMSGD